ncbi:hypothetical protein GGR27_001719 [Lewinella antarctica]|uniref:DUF1800 domain-containing protein n=2 Tax=Neolewinella antarctica TaxID=442734 RepID=A0ABX0XAF5_9BACT|nr:hypothetical protein [Neolewinella antarctica]
MGPKRQEILEASTSGLSATLDKLFAPPALPPPPINHFFTQDPNVAVGKTWVNSPYVAGVDVGKYRYPSLRGWYVNNLIDSPCTINERLTLFWINHFGMAEVSDHRAEYQYIQLFREFGGASFQTMIEKITVHPAMLYFLNGDWSSKYEPNENYARELLELFTIQKGPQIGEGDYTNYTEQDIRTAARILTGWRTRRLFSRDSGPVDSFFNDQTHDDETDPRNPNLEPKQLSRHFGNAVIVSNGADEYKDLIAIIFQQPETARAICRELYRYFVYSDITSEVEDTVITPLAQFMTANNFNVAATLRELLGSKHFYDINVRGPFIKNPYEYYLSILRPLHGFEHLDLSLANNPNSSQIRTIYNIGTAYFGWASSADMDVFTLPTVAGWKAYYQAPNYYRNWIGSASLQLRRKSVRDLTYQGIYVQIEGGEYKPRGLGWLEFVERLTIPEDVIEVVQECIDIFLPRELHPDQFDALKNELLRGQQDREWTIQWNSYLASPSNPDITRPLTNNIKSFFRALFSMAEFHLQ